MIDKPTMHIITGLHLLAIGLVFIAVGAVLG